MMNYNLKNQFISTAEYVLLLRHGSTAFMGVLSSPDHAVLGVFLRLTSAQA